MTTSGHWVLAGGGTGGHLVPGLHLLDELVARGRPPSSLLWFTSGRAVEDRVLAGLEERVGCPLRRVPLELEPPGGGAPSLTRLAGRILPAVRVARRELAAPRPDVVLGLGGFTSVPVVLAARSRGLRADLLEVNAVAGRATRWLAPLCRNVLHAFEASLPARPGGRHVLVGPVVSARFRSLPPGVRGQVRRAWRLPEEVPLLLVLGGSQGAAGLNRFVREHASTLLEAGVAVLHQVGPGRTAEAGGEHALYRPFEYSPEVAPLLAAADLVLCRGGASSLAEVAALGRPAWVVPYPHHPDQHQARNARALGLRVLPESELDGAAAGRLLAELRAPAATSPPAPVAGTERVLELLLGDPSVAER